MTWTGNPGVHSLITQARVIDTTIVEDFAAANPGTLPANQGVVTDGDQFIADDETTVTTLIVANNRVTGSAVTDSAAIVTDEASVAVRGAEGATVLANATAEVTGAALSGVRLVSTQAMVATGTTYETDTGTVTITVEDNVATAAFELDAEYGLVADGEVFQVEGGIVTASVGEEGAITFTFTPDEE